MGAAYSQDLRDRIIAARDDGTPTKQVAELFRVSPSWVRRVMQRRREHGEQAFVEQVLVPELGPGDVVVMDNLSSHKRARGPGS